MSSSFWYLFCGIICALIAGEQNRSAIWGFIWGLLFGLLAVIVYLIIGEKED